MTHPLPTWSSAIDDVFVCAAVRPVAADTVTAMFAPRRPSLLAFAAGQYVTIEFGVDGVPVNRCYSIASPPTRPERLAITVKRTHDGVVSRWIHDGGLRPGDEVRIGDPQGAFTLAAHPAGSYLFLTAGSGITPVLSMLRELYDLGRDADLVLVHSQRRLSEVPYHDELRWLADHIPGMQLHIVCTEQQARLDAKAVHRFVPDLGTREAFVCGPAAYRDAMRAALTENGVDAVRIHEESYTFDTVAVPPTETLEPAAPDGMFTIEFAEYGTTVACAPDSTILDAAMAAGLDVPSSCTQGMCGTCKSTMTSGDVDMHHAGGIRPREIAAGKILLCCSKPLTDLVISTG